MPEQSPLLTAVCISREKQSLDLNIPFVSYTENYQAITHHDNNDMKRIAYMTDRYNRGVKAALKIYPHTRHILVIDHYYLPYPNEIRMLVDDYGTIENVIMGASIWYWNRRRIRPWIAYYDTLSVPEFIERKWWNVRDLPRGLIPVTGVGGCWIFPREVWDRTGGFGIPSPPQAGSSRCLDTARYKIILDCDRKLWRTHLTNPSIPDDPLHVRIRNTARHGKRRLLRAVGRPEGGRK